MPSTWTVTRKSPNNFRIDVNVPSMDQPFGVLLAADVHLDHIHCNQKLFKKHLEMAAAYDMPVVIVGDLFDLMQGVHDRRSFKSDLRPEHKEGHYLDAVVDTTAEFLQPYKDQLAVIGQGNHETSILKHSETNVLARLEKSLGIDVLGGYGGYIEYCFWYGGLLRCRHLMKYYHGSGGGGIVTKGAIGANRRATMYPDADSIVTGHIHERTTITYTSERYNSRSGRVELRNCEHIQLPTYKCDYGQGSGGWHVERGMPPKPLGGVELRFNLVVGDDKCYRVLTTPINHGC